MPELIEDPKLIERERKYKAKKLVEPVSEKHTVSSRLVRRALRGRNENPHFYIGPEGTARLRQYVLTAKWSLDERRIFSAMAGESITPGELEIATGLSKGRIQRAVVALRGKGVVTEIG